MKRSRRLISAVLVVLMLFSMLPASVFAAAGTSYPTVLIAGSDFQAEAGDSASAANVTAILTAMKRDHSYADGLIFCGDYSYNYIRSLSALNTDMGALNGAIDGVYPNITDKAFVQGNHDEVAQGTGDLSGTGAHDTADYRVFIIDEDDYQWASSGIDGSKTLAVAAQLEDYFNEKIEENYTKPVFVASHVPLHYSARTKNDGDGKYASYLFDVINEAAEELTVIYLFGHDHSNGWDNYLGGSAVYLPVGESINVAVAGSQTSYTTETLNFTYMNAGYTGYYANENGSDNTLTMSVFTITDNDVTIERYDAAGRHNLKSAGTSRASGEYTGYHSYTNVIPSPQTVELEQYETVEPDTRPQFTADGGVAIKAFGDGATASIVESNAVYEGIAKYVLYDITVENFQQGTTATVTLPIPSGFDRSLLDVYYVNNGSLESMNAKTEGDYITFDTTHFSQYLIGEREIDFTPWQHIHIEEVTQEHYIYTLDTNGIDSGSSYLIVASGSSYAMDHNRNRQSITISNNTVDLSTDNYEWTITKNGTQSVYNDGAASVSHSNGSSYSQYTGGDYYYKNGNNYVQVTRLSSSKSGNTITWTINRTITTSGRNLQLSLATLGTVDTATIYNGTQYLSRGTTGLTASNTAVNWNVSHSGSGAYSVSRDGNYLRYSNSAFSTGTTNTNTVRLYKRTSHTTETVTEAEDYYLAMADIGNQTFSTTRFANRTELETYLKSLITVAKADDQNGTNIQAVEYTLTPGGTVNPTTPGSVNYTVAYNGHTVGTFRVSFAERQLERIELVDASGKVALNTRGAAPVGAKIRAYYDDGNYEDLPITLDMLSKEGAAVSTAAEDTIDGVTVTYGGKTVGGFTLLVYSNDYPEYPDGGSVKVNKTGSGFDFQETGVAKIELSAAGIPINKGVDVIVMVDTSSSMNDTVTGYSLSRIAMLRNSLNKMVSEFNLPCEDGSPSDVRVALADFNGYGTSGTTSYYSSSDTFGSVRTGSQNTRVYSGNETISAGAFVPSAQITNAVINSISTSSGTNYDYAFDTIYKLGTAIKEQNAANGEERDLYVIFMSDGAPFQYNYFSDQSSTTTWNNWLQGTWNSASEVTGSSQHKYFYNGKGNRHRMAEAIKGSPDEDYTVIVSRADSANYTSGDWKDGQQYMIDVPGLGATMYSIGFCIAQDTSITAQSINYVIESVASVDESGSTLYYDAANQDELDEAFTQISSSIRYAATNARFVDTMGPAFDLTLDPIQMYNNNGVLVNYPNAPETCITVNKYALDSDGKRTGTPAQLEKVWKDSNGNYKSNQLSDTTIINSDGVICANTFYYNTDSTAHTVDGINIPAETFYWKLGTINSSELVLSYYVYLTGALEGTCDPGSYKTNADATLYYTNWLEHDAHLGTVSPVLAWEAASVSYGFYLVNEQGQPVVNQTTGQTGSFERAVKVTNAVVYGTVLLNSADTVSAEIVAGDQLPTYYQLYDEGARYAINVYSGDASGNWTITKGSVPVSTTYVTDYNGNAATTRNSSELTGETVDYTHTTVWFAVKYIVKCYPDTVVIDYGLPVNIDVTNNDMFGTNGTLDSVGTAHPAGDHTAALAQGFQKYSASAALELNYGSVYVNGSKVCYVPAAMEMDGADTFVYAVNYQNGNASTSGYYYGTVNVVPATTIYYEDSFVTFSDEWETVTSKSPAAAQAEDRPGEYSLSAIDANNNYGYDGANEGYVTYSLGSAKKVTVEAGMNEWPTAEFDFTGTGFDVISLTNKRTGFVTVQVSGGNLAKPLIWGVDNYYGYELNNEEAPESSEEEVIIEKFNPLERNSLYQIPVVASKDALDYGTYHVVITPQYYAYFDHTDIGEYDFYLDAIRVYNPAGSGAGVLVEDNEGTAKDVSILDIYNQDHEAFPQYIEIRDEIVDQKAFQNDDVQITGAVFIDGYGVDGVHSDYVNYGPNNEAYLAEGQSIAFKFSATGSNTIATVQIGIKAVVGACRIAVNGGNKSKELNVSTCTDMYYDITNVMEWDQTNRNNSETVIITNTGSNIVSLTNIKVTYEVPAVLVNSPAPELNGAFKTSLFITKEDAENAANEIRDLYAPEVDSEGNYFYRGDVNGDGVVNAKDVIILRKYLALDEEVDLAPGADVDGDGFVGATDVICLRRILASIDEIVRTKKTSAM